jgi:arachidonate 5-lipoxygenase
VRAYDLATFEIERTLDWRESTLMIFSLKNMPKALGMIPARSIYDYNSLNYMRAKTEVARRVRLFSYRVFGMVPPIPDNDNRDAEEWGV